MSKYNEQHATTMLNALIGTETLKEHDAKVRADAIDECIEYFSKHAHEIYTHISARDFICDRLEQLKEQK